MMAVNEIYRVRHAINDLRRVSFTRFRFSGHSLAIEDGWRMQQAGSEAVSGLCTCGSIQTERNDVKNCPATQ